jgi:hypothetical protein
MEMTTLQLLITGNELMAFCTVGNAPDLGFLLTSMVKQGLNLFFAF